MALLSDGRLHLFGGLLPDRATPARDHWSLAVNAGVQGLVQDRQIRS